MTELEELKEAMRSGYQPQPVDIGWVITAGTRLRRRRRLAIGAASGLAVVALLIGVNQVLPQAAPAPGVLVVPADAPSSAAAPDPFPAEDHTPVGEIISTGEDDWLIWAFAMKDHPEISFGLVLGRRAPGGELEDSVATNEVEGSGRSPGFHAVQGAMTNDDGPTPLFGYYAGPATKITGKAGGKTVRARQAAWSEDPDVQVFWFDLAIRDVEKLTAYDKGGKKLPAGNNGIGNG